MHTCPMCMGAQLPIIPPCLPMVLIGGMPAARMTDLCACVAPIPVPVDMIIFGSPTVLIGGLPAARMLDPTAKGGMILKGEPTVLIGLAGMGSMTALGAGSPVCKRLGADRAALAQAQSDGLLASAVYGDPNAPLPPNTRRATQADLEALGLSDGTHDMTRIKDSNFRSDVFVQTDPMTGQESYVVAFKGTDMTSMEDWGANLGQGMGNQTAYYDQAMTIGRTASDAAPGRVRYVGHSLGGGLASAAASMGDSPATTFNSAGLNPSTVERQGGRATGNGVNAYYVEGEVLSGVQDNTPAAGAVGTRHGLPPASATMQNTKSAIGGGVIGGLLAGPLGALAGSLGANKIADAVRLHGMAEVQAALDQEAARIDSEMKANGCT